jgi:hypothetical protein
MLQSPSSKHCPTLSPSPLDSWAAAATTLGHRSTGGTRARPHAGRVDRLGQMGHYHVALGRLDLGPLITPGRYGLEAVTLGRSQLNIVSQFFFFL